ncbi:hypothetical protein VNO77_07960 [Canavalia gladiata]|uniref:Uncharacterized protein n=1 Tax=Canavalia gladiata TaxID=3824 RepID=A0AAN9R0U6_CANGL
MVILAIWLVRSDPTLKVQPPSKLQCSIFILMDGIESRLRHEYANPWIPSRFACVLIIEMQVEVQDLTWNFHTKIGLHVVFLEPEQSFKGFLEPYLVINASAIACCGVGVGV